MAVMGGSARRTPQRPLKNRSGTSVATRGRHKTENQKSKRRLRHQEERLPQAGRPLPMAHRGSAHYTCEVHQLLKLTAQSGSDVTPTATHAQIRECSLLRALHRLGGSGASVVRATHAPPKNPKGRFDTPTRERNKSETLWRSAATRSPGHLSRPHNKNRKLGFDVHRNRRQHKITRAASTPPGTMVSHRRADAIPQHMKS